MRFNGEWLQCDDGVVRPVIRAEIPDGDGRWRPFELLVDTGADRTVISANVLDSLNLAMDVPHEQIGGIGGIFDVVPLTTAIRLLRDDGQRAIFRGDYAACTAFETLDMSVLGRDILDMFSLIVERRTETIAILGGQHTITVNRTILR